MSYPALPTDVNGNFIPCRWNPTLNSGSGGWEPYEGEWVANAPVKVGSIPYTTYVASATNYTSFLTGVLTPQAKGRLFTFINNLTGANVEVTQAGVFDNATTTAAGVSVGISTFNNNATNVLDTIQNGNMGPTKWFMIGNNYPGSTNSGQTSSLSNCGDSLIVVSQASAVPTGGSLDVWVREVI